ANPACPLDERPRRPVGDVGTAGRVDACASGIRTGRVAGGIGIVFVVEADDAVADFMLQHLGGEDIFRNGCDRAAAAAIRECVRKDENLVPVGVALGGVGVN